MAEYIQLLGNICLVPCDAKMFIGIVILLSDEL